MDLLKCVCGHSDADHIDGCEQCCIIGCGCKEFEMVCEFCGGTGVVIVDAPVYPGEPHMAPIGERPCICQANKDNND